MKSLIVALIIFSTSVFAETALTNRLRKNDTYDKLYSKIDTTSSDSNVSDFSSKVTAAFEAQKELESTESSRAKLYYQEDVDAKPCASCPKYLDLVLQVNQIVEKTKDTSVQNANEKMVALTKLKFLYYTVKSTDEDNNVTCKTYNPMLPSEKKSYERGSLSLAAEQALALPDVNSVQLYEGKGKEVHYFYKGEGNEADNVVEVVIMPDGKSIIKYYKYDNGLNLPTMGEAQFKKMNSRGDNYIDLTPTVKTEHFVLPTDIGFGSMGTKYSISDDLDLRNKTEFGFNKQGTNVSVLDKSGNKYLIIEGENITDGKKTVDAVVNYDFDLSSDSKLKLGTSVGNTTETVSEDLSDGVTNKQSVRMGITDHNNEYIKVRTYVDDKGVSSVGVGNKYKVGEGSVGADVEVGRDGSKKYSVDVFDQNYLSSAGFSYEQSIYNERSVGVNVGANLDPEKSLRLSTGFTRSDTEGSAVKVNLQKKINENTSMVLSLGKSEKEGASVLYQFETKF
ncbi:hypothetical protein SHI21_16500 [Bacteriovorax sp. PP10]|uniref:Autotransporter domain-containing protein n=1 Tax=Bacteriovorax antarcticus TaxID=3088717 RepID=A0ABU5VZN7_9BACT|nr:hypothetical protein [Bacteriovorax sp. PP10]MEA9357833.1 hypothetical protein [Bacteriovorax sp. PP10]